jgi:uncharacterized protein (DUF1697 family)
MRVVALLRGVNIGGHKIDMAHLRRLLSNLGFEDVQTYLQSGNAVFTTEGDAGTGLTDKLEEAIEAEFGFACRVILRDAVQLAACMADDPLLPIAIDPSRHLVGFLSGPPVGEGARELMAADYGADRLHIGRDHLYMWCPNGVSKSPFFKINFDRSLGVAVTARNWNTVTKLAGMLGS